MPGENTNLSSLLAEAIAAADPAIEQRLDSDPDAYLDILALTDRAHDETAILLATAVASARSAGHSWDAIGKVLGMSRQAAQQRFGKDRQPGSDAPEGETRVLTGLTAFNEMEVLNRAGRFGWHSVGHGVLFHTLTRSNEQWEHRRVLIGSPSLQRLKAEGWQQAGDTWFPWVYLTRSNGEPAIMEVVSDSYLLHG